MDEREAKHGEKTIGLTVYFFTNDIATEKDKIVPKHAWTSGEVVLKSNPSHGIKSGVKRHFHSLLGMATAIEDLLIEGEIILHPHPTGKTRKYVQEIKED